MDDLEENNSHITLDYIDNYLSRNNYLCNNTIRQLWNKDDYYEFNVVEDCIDKLSNVNKYKCHICNIEVPVTYKKEHNNSMKHKTYMKIADKALERTRLHMKQENEPNIRIQLKNTFFCEACVAVVQEGDKIKHEKSDTHTISVKHDKLLNELLLIYTDRNNVEFGIGDNVTGVDSDKKGITNNDKLSTEVNIKNVNRIELHNDYKGEKINEDEISTEATVKNGNAINFIDDKKEIISHIKSQTNVNAIFPLKSYITTFCESYKDSKMHSLAVVKNDQVEITALNGDKITVAAINFDGFNKLGDIIQCKLCKVVIEGNVETHKLTKMHMDRAMTVIKDKHCIRQIDDWNHCILCNELFYDINLHIESVKHKYILGEAKGNLNSVKTAVDQTENKTYCAPCNLYVHTHNFKSHLSGNNHKYKTKKNAQETIETSSKAERSSLDNNNIIHHHVSKTANPKEYNCDVCKTKILWQNIQEHVKGSGHNIEFNNLLSANSIKLVDNEFCCNACGFSISKLNIIKHVNSKNHISLLNKPVSTTTAVPSTSKANIPTSSMSESYCNICNVEIPGKGKNIHYEGKPHKNNVKKLSKKGGTKQPPAKVNVVAPESNIQISPKSVKAIPAKDNLQSPAKDNTQISGKPCHYLMKMPEYPYLLHYLCIICDVQVPRNPSNVNEHVKGNIHVTNYDIIIARNKLSKTTETGNQYYCAVCKINIKNKEEIVHVDDTLHKLSLALFNLSSQDK